MTDQSLLFTRPFSNVWIYSKFVGYHQGKEKKITGFNQSCLQK